MNSYKVHLFIFICFSIITIVTICYCKDLSDHINININGDAIISSTGSNTQYYDRYQIASQYHSDGIYHANLGDYVKSLAYLRTTCRIYNSSSQFWNDLGVTEMRLGQYLLAKTRFMKSLHIDKHFIIAIQNLHDLEALIPANQNMELAAITSYEQYHSLSTLRSISIDELNNKDFDSIQNILLQPFIIRNFTDITGWNKKVFSIRNLQTSYYNRRVDYYPHNMQTNVVRPFFTSLNDSLNQLMYFPTEVYETVDITNKGTYIQWNIDEKTWNQLLKRSKGKLPNALTDSSWIYNCLEDIDTITDYQLKTHWKMILIGEEGSGMFNHQDTLRTSSWQVQLLGRKKWHLCSPLDSSKMYEAGQINTFHPDYKHFPLFRNVKTCIQDITNPGDLLFYPMDYWHQTENLDTPTLSLSGTIITRQNYQFVEEELRKECSNNNPGKVRTFQSDDSLCPKLEKCYRIWKDLFSE